MTTLKTIKDPDKLSFFDHADELRNRLIKSLAAVLICSCLTYIFIDYILALIIEPVDFLVFTAPSDAFIARITLTLWLGFFISLPYVFFQIWKFIGVGLRPQERRYISFFAPYSVVFFMVGALFAYTIAIPITIEFLLGYGNEYLRPMITVKSYISFMATLILAFGFVFELPLVLMFLTKIGIATPEFLMQKRKHAYILILILSALITPPDIVTLLILGGPLVLLYEIGIFVSKATYRDSFK